MRAWIPVLVWAATIFTLSSLPGSAYPRTSVPQADKLVHLALYGILGGLLARAVLIRRTLGERGDARRTRALLLVAIVLASAYGVSDEAHQWFVPGRSVDWRDALADATGALLGCMLAARVWGRPSARP
jgi:VanZ family protein